MDIYVTTYSSWFLELYTISFSNFFFNFISVIPIKCSDKKCNLNREVRLLQSKTATISYSLIVTVCFWYIWWYFYYFRHLSVGRKTCPFVLFRKYIKGIWQWQSSSHQKIVCPRWKNCFLVICDKVALSPPHHKSQEVQVSVWINNSNYEPCWQISNIEEWWWSAGYDRRIWCKGGLGWLDAAGKT